jgi:hypothetical protein
MKATIVSTYNEHVRPKLPVTADTKTVSSIEIVSLRYRRHRLDTLVPVPTPYDRYLKERNIALIRDAVEPADVGVSIGGGYGVTAIALSEFVDNLHVYEGSTDLVKQIERNLAANDVTAHVKEAIVGEAVDIDGESSAETVSPKDLPEADVIEMDCEGAELSILANITEPPPSSLSSRHTPPTGHRPTTSSNCWRGWATPSTGRWLTPSMETSS